MSDTLLLERVDTPQNVERPNIALPPPPPLEAPKEPELHPVDVVAWYNQRVDAIHAKQVEREVNPWKLIEEKASSVETQRRYVPERIKSNAIADTVRRQELRIRAFFSGVRDLKKFDQVVDYLESTIYEDKVKEVDLGKNPSNDKISKIGEKWKAKGYRYSAYSDIERGDAKTTLRLHYAEKFKAGEHHLEGLKVICAAEDPVAMLGLMQEKLGFSLSAIDVNYPEYAKQTVDFINSPHAKEVIEIASQVQNWSGQWHTLSSNPEPGLLSTFAQWAKLEDPNTFVSQDTLRKIDLISRVNNTPVDASNFEDFRSLVEDHDFARFAALMVENGIRSGYESPFIRGAKLARDSGLMIKVLEANSAGISTRDIIQRFFPSNYDKWRHDAEITSEVRNIFQEKQLKDLLDDSDKRDFCAVLADITGHKIPHYSLENFHPRTDVPGYKEQYTYIANMLYEGRNFKKFNYADNGYLDAVLNTPRMVEAFTSQEFADFINSFNKLYGYTPQLHEYIDVSRAAISSPVIAVFSDKGLRQDLIDPKAKAFADLLKTKMEFSKAADIVKLSKQPGMLESLNTAISLGMLDKVKYHDLIYEAGKLGELGRDIPGFSEKLADPAIKEFADRVLNTYGWKPTISDAEDLLKVIGNTELTGKYFDTENVQFIRAVGEGWMKTFVIEEVVALEPNTREVILNLNKHFGYKLDTYRIWEWDKNVQAFKYIAENAEFAEKLFSPDRVNLIQRLVNESHYTLRAQDLISLANAPEDLADFTKQLADKYSFFLGEGNLDKLIAASENREQFLGSLKALEGSGYIFVLKDVEKLSQLESVVDKLPQALGSLREASGYRFKIEDIDAIKYVAESGIDSQRIKDLIGLYAKYKATYHPEFTVEWLPQLARLYGHEDVIQKLAQFGYKFDISSIDSVSQIFELQDKEPVYKTLELLRTNLDHPFTPFLAPIYIALAQRPDLQERLTAIRETPGLFEDIRDNRNFVILAGVDLDPKLYTKTVEYLREGDIDFWLANKSGSEKNFKGLVKMIDTNPRDREKIISTLKFIHSIELQGQEQTINTEVVNKYVAIFGEYQTDEVLDTLRRYWTDNIINPTNENDLDDVGGFIREMGPLYVPAMFLAYKSLKNGQEPFDNLKSLGITKTGQEGILQMRDVYRKITREFVTTGRTNEPVDNPFVSDVLVLSTRFAVSQWTRYGKSMSDVVNKFNNEVASGEISPVPVGYTPETVRIRQLIDNREFTFAQPAVDKFRGLRGELREAAELSRNPDEVTTEKVKADLKTKFEAINGTLKNQLEKLEESLNQKGVTDEKRREAARRSITSQQEKLNAFLDRVDDHESTATVIKSLIELGGNSQNKDISDVATTTLRKLLFTRAIGINPEYATDPVDLPASLVDARNLPVHAVLRMMEVMQNGVKFETLPTLELTPAETKYLEKSVIDTTAFKEEIKRSQQVSEGAYEEFTVYPNRSLLTEFSGYYSDACWTRADDIVKNNPNIIGFPFVKEVNGIPTIYGGSLLIETKLKSGERAVVIRGINPRENVIRKLSAEDFFERTVDVVEKWAKARGIDYIVAPFGSSGALSNRPTINSYVSSKYQGTVALGEEVNFNGYDITNGVLVVRKVSQDTN